MLPLPGLDGIEQRAWQQFLNCSLNVLAGLNESLMDAHNISIRDVLLLELLNRPDRRSHRLCALARSLWVSKGQLTTQIRRLEGLGWITRSPNRRDARGMLLRITSEGHMHLNAVLETYAREVRAQYLDYLQHEHMVSLVDGCRRINGSLNTSGVKGSPERRARG
ncbi:MarR family transcriptional regulator [Mycobacterium sp. SMC-14]|uniref:MarR family transcriptional regulator n=1 Tax=Mycobacterium sp. SMC-14 TaxID=3385968 RepID=UPI00390CD339